MSSVMEFTVSLRRNDHYGFGFSLLGHRGLPPIIYDILEDSAIADCGQVEVGDIILAINGSDVSRFTTKEVLKCLRLSPDPVQLKLRRDPVVKSCVQEQLSLQYSDDDLLAHEQNNNNNMSTTSMTSSDSSNPFVDKNPFSSDNGKKNGAAKPKFEAYMMTGEHILNLSRMQQQTALTRYYQKTIDSLWNCRTTSVSATGAAAVADENAESKTKATKSLPTSPTTTKALDSCVETEGLETVGIREEREREKERQTTAFEFLVSSTATSPITNDRIVWTYNAPVTTTADSRAERFAYQSSTSLPSASPTSPTSISSSVMSDSVSQHLNQPMMNGTDDQLAQLKTHCAQNGHHHEQQQHQKHYGSAQEACDLHAHSSGAAFTNNCDLSQTETILSPDFHDVETADILNNRELLMELSDCSADSDSMLMMMTASSSESRAKKVGSRNRQSLSPESVETMNGSGGINDSACDYKIVIQAKCLERDSLAKRKSSRDSSVSQHISGYKELKNSEVTGYNYDDDDDNENENDDNDNDDDDDDNYENDENHKNKNHAYSHSVANQKSSSPPLSEDESDIESLHSFHLSPQLPRPVDIPSAVRLAKRLFTLDGFKRKDVSRHLSKNNEFSRVVAEEYFKYFHFENERIDESLRKFLQHFCLVGETQERERVLLHFAKRYYDQNQDKECNLAQTTTAADDDDNEQQTRTTIFKSCDSVHTLTCALMMLNMDIHNRCIERKMTCNEFIENLVGLNEGENYPETFLRTLYNIVKTAKFQISEDCMREDFETNYATSTSAISTDNRSTTAGKFSKGLFTNHSSDGSLIEYKQGYMMRKCVCGPNAKKVPFHKRRWKMIFFTLRDLTLLMYKDQAAYQAQQQRDKKDASVGGGQSGGANPNAIRINHSLSTIAKDYTKKQNVFRLLTADRSEFLFQTSDKKELDSWIETLNFVAASFSAHPLEAAVSSKNNFQRPILSYFTTKLSLKEQLKDHEDHVDSLEIEYKKLLSSKPDNQSKSKSYQNLVEKENFLKYEINRYRTYAFLMRSRLSNYPEFNVLPNDVYEKNKQLCQNGDDGCRSADRENNKSNSETVTAALQNDIIERTNSWKNTMKGAVPGVLTPPPIPVRNAHVASTQSQSGQDHKDGSGSGGNKKIIC